MSFGKAFGELVKRRRGIEGMTQQALALIAFGDERYKTRISELENGKTAKPQAKTIDALVVALKIPDEELTQLLNHAPHPDYIENLSDLFDVSEKGRLHAEIGIESEEGGAFFLYECPMKCAVKRLEFFTEEQVLIWVTDAERRRHFGMPLDKSVAQHLVKRTEITFYFIGKGLENAEPQGTYPLKIID